MIDFYKIFVEAAKKTIETQADVKIISSKQIPSEDISSIQGDISGILAMQSENIDGYLSLTFPEKTFLGIVGSMLGEDYTSLSSDIEDAAAELANIVYGNAKGELFDQGCHFNKSIPSVIKGANHYVKRPKNANCFLTEFSTQKGDFLFLLTTKNREEK